MTTSSSSHTNRLAGEKSPYLLQHQHNPVDWFPWGEAAFAKAQKEDKPIFLSIGYSTCHWCHVMERESFEDVELAKYLNAHFVSIKVDREERPDVDRIYMTFVQAIAGQGGWPLNVFLTADRKPFYGGTYFPPDSRYGRPSFLQVLNNITDLWQSRRTDLINSARQLHEQLAHASASEPPSGLVLSAKMLREAATQSKQHYDPQHGGFGGAPKFPRPSEPSSLLRYALRNGDAEAKKMVLHTCQAMATGGICDQIGGGFHRYSVDAEWLVPHFEKMLYDNAQLAQLYLDAYLVSGDAQHAAVVRDILQYVARDMTHAEGGFYSAEDADSEGKEGKFYCWTKAEVSQLLTREEFDLAVRYFGITEQGNFVDHSDPNPLPNQNVLRANPQAVSERELPLLETAKKKLFAARARRVRPHLDDKVLTSWNGMMLGAFAKAFAVLGNDEHLKIAETNLHFLQAKLWDASTKTLYNRWRDGERDSVQLLDSYANLLTGVLQLYEATLQETLLSFALDLADSMVTRFYDKEHGGFYQSAGASDLILQVKDDYDGAEPSGNSVAVLALLKLAAITERGAFREAAEATLRLFADRLENLPQAVPHLLLGLDFWLEEPKRVVLAGNPRSASTRTLLRAVHSVYQPNKVVLGTTGPVEPLARSFPIDRDQAQAYICTANACQPPTSDATAIKQMLK